MYEASIKVEKSAGRMAGEMFGYGKTPEHALKDLASTVGFLKYKTAGKPKICKERGPKE